MSASDDRLALGFDTSAAHCAVAVTHGNTTLSQCLEEMSRGQAERLFPLIEQALAEAGVAFSDLAAIGVGTGPGNFTGTRIAVSAARGLALGLGIPAEGIPVTEAYADGRPGVIVCLPAPRGAVILSRDGETLTQQPDAPLPPGWGGPVTGPVAGEVAHAHGLDSVQAPPLAPALARLAAARAAPGRSRPAPVYLRPADAAPASDPPPRIL